MPHQRPGFTRQNTDTVSLKSLGRGQSSKSKLAETESIGGEKADAIGTDNALPPYGGEEPQIHDDAPVATAEDLVTQVIHVEDDPSLNPWTFRMFFLGMTDWTESSVMLMLQRHWPVNLWLHSTGNLLL